MNTAPPPLPDPSRKDAEHLKVLVICHYVGAGLSVLGLCFVGAHFALMRTIFCNPKMWEGQKGGPPPQEIFGIFQWFYLVAAVVLLAYTVLNVVSAMSIRARRRRILSLVVAGLNCMHMPLGTILGVFTILVLTRDSVRNAYHE